MATIYFDKDHGDWRCKWRSRRGDKLSSDPKARMAKWTTVTLCKHPGWVRGAKVPSKAPYEATQLYRKYEDLEIAANHGVEVGPARAVQLADFLQAYLTRCEAAHAPGTMRGVRRIVAVFLEWCNGRRVTTVPQVTVEVCRDFLAERTKTARRSTMKTERGILMPAWSAAVEEGRLTENPWLRAKVPGKDREEQPPFWTREEVVKLTAAAPAWLKDIITVGVYSGLRINALLRLRWRDIDFAKGTIHVRAVNAKGGRAYDTPLMGPARDVLQRLLMRDKRTGEGRIFSRPRSGNALDQSNTFTAIRTAVKKSGIPNHGHFNHILRHSFATWAVNSGVPLKVVSTWLGHSTIQMTEKYAHADASETQRWAEVFSSTPAAPDRPSN